MNKFTKDAPFYILIVFAVYISAQPAQAYLDPSTGSFAFQGLMAGTFAILYHAKAAVNWLRKTNQIKTR